MKIKVREILGSTIDQLYSLPDRVTLIFEDGVEIETSRNKTIFNSCLWEMHRKYPNTPILSTHHIETTLKGEALTEATVGSILGIIYKDVIKAYDIFRPKDREPILELTYRVVNNIFNEVSELAEPYIISIDILDFVKVTRHPNVMRQIEGIKNKTIPIAVGYSEIIRIIKTCSSLQDTSLVMAIKSNIVNSQQILQMVGIRGYVTEVDGSILPTPVNSNYVLGMTSLYDFVADSRTSAKALYLSESPLQDAEYFARRLQLIEMYVERINYIDCGSERYLEWKISPPVIDEGGNKVYPGDLTFMIGKNYLDDETNTLKEIVGDDSSLYGKVLKIRSPIYCKEPDPHAVCYVCFGGLCRNVSRFANIGHLSVATMTRQTTQSVLSTKHLAVSSIGTPIVLSEHDRNYLSVSKDRSSYLVNPRIQKLQPKLIINSKDLTGISDILSMDEFDPIRISCIDTIEIICKERDDVNAIIFVGQDNRAAMLTKEFLYYVKEHKWKVDDNNNFLFDLADWDYNLPILTLPNMEYSYSDHSHQIAKIIESNMQNIAERSTPHSPAATLYELFNLVNIKLNVNIVALEIIIYGSMIESSTSHNLARNSPEAVLGVSGNIMKSRSMSTFYAYQRQSRVVLSPASFYPTNRPDSPTDVFIKPYEVTYTYNFKHGDLDQYQTIKR